MPAACAEMRSYGLRLRGMSSTDPTYSQLLGKYMELARLCKKASRGDPSSSSGGTEPAPPGVGPSGARPSSVPPAAPTWQALAMLAKLPRGAQHELLKKFGDDMVSRGAANCNIFGGKESCIPLSKTSVFAKTCVNHPLLVDCAFYDESLGEIDDDPTDDLRDEVAAQHEQPCEGCDNNLKELYCAQAVPMCGTFETHLESSVLPALIAIVHAKETGGDFMAITASLIPSLAKTTALTAPCKRYCQAITASCSCRQSQTFGDMLRQLQTGDNKFLPTLPPAVQQQLFSKLDDTPLCDLYADENDPEFSGHCPPEDILEDTQCGWCADNAKVPMFVQEYLADSLLNGIFGWLIGPEGLLADADIFSGEDDDEDDVNPDESGGSFDGDDGAGGGGGGGGGKGRKHGAKLALVVFLWIFGLGCAGVAAGAGVLFYRRYQEQRGVGGFAGKVSYAPMGDFSGDDFGDYSAPDLDSI
jgi:hypothetical protein